MDDKQGGDRSADGRRLAQRLRHYGPDAPFVVGLSGGGVVVGAQIARHLRTPLDVIVTAGITSGPDSAPEVGAAALGDVAYFDPDFVDSQRLTLAALERMALPAFAEARRRTRRLRGAVALPEVAGQVVILADDGVSPPAGLMAGIWALHGAGARRVILALGRGSPALVARLRLDGYEVYCLEPTGNEVPKLDPVADDDVRRTLTSWQYSRRPAVNRRRHRALWQRKGRAMH